ncbi:MAG: MFS transporter [Streptosporangiales bacterium]|nr:MFS transporter [Streptosporangiales bacterium]
MSSPYRELFAMPGTRGFVVAGFLARVSMSMNGLGIVLLLSEVTGSYGVAGAVAATEALATAVAAPQIGRIVDRHGQRRVLLPVAGVHGAALAALMVCAELGAAYWTLFLAAAVAGVAYPVVGALVRVRWSHLLGGGRRLETAFSLESVLDEVVFVTGPVVVTVLATQVHRLSGLSVAGLLTVTGSVAFALQRRTEPPAGRRSAGSGRTVIGTPGFAPLTLVFLGMGTVFGSLEVTVVAFSEEQDARAAAGAVLGLQALGSLVAGLAYGARHWSTPIDRRFRIGLLGFAAGLLPLVLMPNVPALAVVIFLGGIAISPTLIPGFGLIERLVPPHARNEGFAWVTTAIGVGLAAGAPIAGRVVDAAGGRPAFLVPVAAGLLAALVGVMASRRLKLGPPHRPVDADNEPE